MANYYGQGRTNYVRVKDKEKFKELCGEFNCEFIEDSEGRVGFLAADDDGFGGLPTLYGKQDDDGEIIEGTDDEQRDIFDEVPKHLKKGEVMVFIHAGSEKMRYLVGSAVAINSDGKLVSIDLETAILDKAKKLTNKPKNITSPQY